MGVRGRPSTDELSTATVTHLPARPDPPRDLSGPEAIEWREIVHRLPADWFPRETHGLLAQYCRHVVASRRVAQLVEGAGDDDVPALARLLRMQVAQSSAIAALASKMRLAQSATIDRRRVKAAGGQKPWE